MHVIVADLGYGDAGKGGVVDWLCRSQPVHTVVRFNGGAQAAHNVVAPDDRHHTFAQFGSGTLAGAATYLSRFTLIDPLAMTAEAEHLAELGIADPFALVTADSGAPLTTPYHQAANQVREIARGAARHGSCGMGIGETAHYALRYPEDAPRAGDCLGSGPALERKLTLLRDRLLDEHGVLLAGSGTARPVLPPPGVVADAYRAWAEQVTVSGDGYLAGLLGRPGTVVFEGAQGVLLDEWHGFHPFTTWSTTTFANAETLLAEAGAARGALRLGVTRAYQTRHGPGPFVSEDRGLHLPEPHNLAGRWQGGMRAGHLDAVTLRYAVEVCGGVDGIALTHLDTARAHDGALRLCQAYRTEQGTTDRLAPGPAGDLDHARRLPALLRSAAPVYGPAVPWQNWPETVASVAGAPVLVRSSGPAATAKSGSIPAVRPTRT